MMPEMMEGMFDVMKPERMMGMMHEAMPKMMDHCFSQMDETQQRNMLAMCREKNWPPNRPLAGRPVQFLLP